MTTPGLRGVPRRVLTALVTTAVAVASLAGCSDSAPTSPVALPEKNIDQWVLPMDQYQLRWADQFREEYVQAQLAADCMQSAGYDLEVPWRDLNGPVVRPNRNSVGRKIFTRDLAETYGYHAGPSPEPTIGDWLAYGESLGDLSDEQQTALGTCIERAHEELPPLSLEANLAAGITFGAYEGALEDDEVKAAADRWRECMLPLGITDLPTSPLDMPPASISTDVLDSPAEEPNVSPAEIAIATHDFDCRVSSGFREALYEAEWSRQVELLDQHLDELVRYGQIFEERREHVNALLGLAPVD